MRNFGRHRKRRVALDFDVRYRGRTRAVAHKDFVVAGLAFLHQFGLGAWSCKLRIFALGRRFIAPRVGVDARAAADRQDYRGQTFVRYRRNAGYGHRNGVVERERLRLDICASAVVQRQCQSAAVDDVREFANERVVARCFGLYSGVDHARVASVGRAAPRHRVVAIRSEIFAHVDVHVAIFNVAFVLEFYLEIDHFVFRQRHRARLRVAAFRRRVVDAYVVGAGREATEFLARLLPRAALQFVEGRAAALIPNISRRDAVVAVDFVQRNRAVRRAVARDVRAAGYLHRKTFFVGQRDGFGGVGARVVSAFLVQNHDVVLARRQSVVGDDVAGNGSFEVLDVVAAVFAVVFVEREFQLRRVFVTAHCDCNLTVDAGDARRLRDDFGGAKAHLEGELTGVRVAVRIGVRHGYVVHAGCQILYRHGILSECLFARTARRVVHQKHAVAVLARGQRHAARDVHHDCSCGRCFVHRHAFHCHRYGFGLSDYHFFAYRTAALVADLVADDYGVRTRRDARDLRDGVFRDTRFRARDVRRIHSAHFHFHGVRRDASTRTNCDDACRRRFVAADDVGVVYQGLEVVAVEVNIFRSLTFVSRVVVGHCHSVPAARTFNLVWRGRAYGRCRWAVAVVL